MQIKVRNYHAINAWQRSSAGPMKGKRYKDEDWRKDWEKESEELYSEDQEKQKENQDNEF
jgi:hypothetical protein